MAGENRKYMTIGQVAQRFGVSTRTVKRWWLSGASGLDVWGPHHLIGTTGLRFTRKSVDNFEQKGNVRADEYCQK